MALWTRLDAALTANVELVAKVEALTARVAELEAKLGEPQPGTAAIRTIRCR